MKTLLSIHEQALAAEARIVKRLEKARRRNLQQRIFLHEYRVNYLRKETRCAHLALAFLRGRHYQHVEQPLRPKNRGHMASKNQTRTVPDWDRVEQLAEDFGGPYFENAQDLHQKFAEWRDAALGLDTPSVATSVAA